MFTSRAEYRLSIRSDNADLRLMDIGHKIGLISELCTRNSSFTGKRWKPREKAADAAIPSDEDLFPWNIQKVNEELEISSKYNGYINRQELNANKIAKYENKKIPKDLDFKAISSLSRETKEKLEKINPETLGQAHRIPGITPTDIVFLNIAIEKLARQ
jgi:tRNA uridine 5-carboxymethylaminomethyl modification enzyme